MHGEKLIIGFRRHNAGVGPGQLQAYDQGLNTAHQQEDEGNDDVTQADLLMIDAAQPADQTGLRLPDLFQPGFCLGRGSADVGGACRHQRNSVR